ncbi:MAG: EVE domain-containing protein, partial [Syntrophobacteraceae bacterium]
MTDKRFWIGVVSREHVQRGIRGGFVQLSHGRKAPLQRLRAGDGFIYYSPGARYPTGDICQMFTAIGIVKSSVIYQ